MRRLLFAGALAAALVAVAVASGATTLAISADPSGKLAFNKKALVAKKGKVTIVMKNPAILPHNVAIKKTKSAKKDWEREEKPSRDSKTFAFSPALHRTQCGASVASSR